MTKMFTPTYTFSTLLFSLIIAFLMPSQAVAGPDTCLNAANLDDLVSCVKSYMPEEGSEGYRAPTEAERLAWKTTIAQIIGAPCQSVMLPQALAGHYTVDAFIDNGQTYCVLLETTDGDQDGYVDVGWGTFIFNPSQQAKAFSIDVPHPLHDGGTPEQGIAVFKGVQARTFVMAGAHRHANAATCDCVPNHDYGEADVAHNPETAFQVTFEAMTEHYGLNGLTAFQFHGLGESSCSNVDAYITHGSTREPLASAVIDQLKHNLLEVIPNDWDWLVTVPGDTPSCSKTGTGNVQGRLLSGIIPEGVCQRKADSYRGNFVHIEQKAAQRSPDAYPYWIAALNAIDFNLVPQPPGYWLTSPNNGEIWTTGEEVTIEWTSQNINDEVSLALYNDDGYYQNLDPHTTDDGSHTFTLSHAIDAGVDYKIRIKSIHASEIRDYSELPFTVEQGLPDPELTVVAPNGGDLWEWGTEVELAWETGGLSEDVKLALFKGNSYHKTIANTAPNTGSFVWEVPESVGQGDDYRFRVRSTDDFQLVDFSDAFFSVGPGPNTPSLTMTNPNGGETWTLGETVSVQWETNNVEGNVKLALFEGNTYRKTIVNSTANDGEYTWEVPGWLPTGDNFRVRVRSTEDISIVDFSDAYFSLVDQGAQQETTLLSVEGNYPNPFNPETTIRYQLTAPTHVAVAVYDVTGRKVAQLIDGPQAAGAQTVRFDASHLPSGFYLYRVSAGAQSLTGKMLLLK